MKHNNINSDTVLKYVHCSIYYFENVYLYVVRGHCTCILYLYNIIIFAKIIRVLLQ